MSKDLERILETQKRLQSRIKTEIQFGEPILWQNNLPVLFPRTINVIQGKAGVHKSRLAECICAALLKSMNCETEVLGFSRGVTESYAVCYVDTERNLSEQLPFALQQLQLRAGFQKHETPEKFSYISLLEIEREKRFQVLNSYVEFMKETVDKNLLIVLDVITDCMHNFNDSKDSMRLIDLMNRSINEHDVTFLCLIHENPGGGEKARGHLGTELINKCTTVLQIGFAKDKSNKELDLLRMRFLKCRNSKKHKELYLQYDEKSRSLVPASEQEIMTALRSRNFKAGHEEIISLLGEMPDGGMRRKEILAWMQEELLCGKRTLIIRLKEMVTEGVLVKKGSLYYELKTNFDGKEVIYYLSAKNNYE